ncbi:DUF2703 domain-containing protein [Aminomonas paucivorans]|uniref:DUF2703 domain-containing protein n=1 Tax=Aminomonas paucivorans TaxID=81412 RepID=UPI003329C78F
MNQIQIRHYRVEGLACTPWAETLKTLNDLCRQMAPRFAAMDLQLALQEVELPDTPENRAFGNLVTLACPEADQPETALEALLGVRVEHDPCEECGDICRTLVVEEGARFQALPSGLLMDGILRMAFSVIAPEGGCSGSCGSCSGCCG